MCVDETNTSAREPYGSDTLADMNQPPGHMHEPFLQKGLTCSEENSYRLEANAQGRGTVSFRICLAAKQGKLEPVRIGFFEPIRPRATCLVKLRGLAQNCNKNSP